MLLTLFAHQWKQLKRNSYTGGGIAGRIIMAVVALYALGGTLAAGILLKEMLQKIFPGQDIYHTFFAITTYYFMLDLVLRFSMQSLSGFSVYPYLLQNVRKRTLATFFIARSYFTIFNLLPLVFFIPFSINAIAPAYGKWNAALLIVNIFLLATGNHYFIQLLKRKTLVNNWWPAGFFMAVIACIILDRYGLLPVAARGSGVFTALMRHPVFSVFPLLWVVLLLVLNYVFLLRHFFLPAESRMGKNHQVSYYGWFRQFGLPGELLSLDLKLVWRNKRPSSTTAISFLVLLYGAYFYSPAYLNTGKTGFLLFVAMFMTGSFTLNLGQFLFAWQSASMDGIMTSNIGLRRYIKSKLSLMTFTSTALFLLSLFYGFISWKVVPLQLAAYLFNIGINAPMAAYFSTYYYKGLDTGKSALLNFQQIGASQFLYTLSLLGAAICIYIPFWLLFNSWAAVAAFGVAGITGLLLRERQIAIIANRFKKNKYKLLAGFRSK